MQKEIQRIIEYFEIFSYFPSFFQIHTFYPKKINQEKLRKELNLLVKLKILCIEANLYTRGEYGRKGQKLSHYALSSFVRDKELKRKMKKQKNRAKITKRKVERIRKFIDLLARIPQIQLVGMSGSAAMSNTNEKDDIDLFIISSKNRIWTTRVISLFLASIFNLRRHRIELNPGNKVCLNLFFDEKDIEAPDFKKNYFVAHEIIQMKPIIIKNNIYFRFLESNKWIFNVFPNAKNAVKENEIKKSIKVKQTRLGNNIEVMLKKLQLWLINKHKTTEFITNNQLWFFPDDYEKKLPMWARRRYNNKVSFWSDQRER